jgi:5-deoxy-glucuronate isomerase
VTRFAFDIEDDTATGRGPRLTTLLRAGEQTKHISLDMATGSGDAAVQLEPGRERLVVMFRGQVKVVVDGRDLGIAGGRGSVFTRAADAVYLPPDATASLVGDESAEGHFVAAIAGAEAGERSPGNARIISSASQSEVTAGRDLWERTVRTILGPKDAASRLLVGETIHSALGTWSSFPPHRHDRESHDEVRLEEVYLYRVDPSNGFGVQLRYDTDTGAEEARIVHDGDVATIPRGFHPVAAMPGHRLYYLWIMAGEGRELRPYLDPRYRWLAEQP